MARGTPPEIPSPTGTGLERIGDYMSKLTVVFYILLGGYSFYSLFFANGGVLIPFIILFLYSLSRDMKAKDYINNHVVAPFFHKDDNPRL